MELIISALVFAIKKVGEKAADELIKSGLNKIKEKLLASGNGNVKESLADLEKNPSDDGNIAILAKDIKRAGIAETNELKEIAETLLNGSEEGKNIINQVVAAGGKAVIVTGKHNTVTIN